MFKQKQFTHLVEERIIRDQSLRKASAQVGVHYSTLCRIRQGKLPSRSVLSILCRAMDVSIDSLFGEE